MVPHSSRGHSFAGASMYLFHDKKAQTTERVEWCETYNVPTEDRYKAVKWMQYTAMNANKLKRDMGVPTTGRKSTKGAVYTYSLSWAKEETPDREHMKSCLIETLEVLGLKDHEAVFVSHNDTEHPHVHALVNLISPIDGKMNTLYNDQKKLSKWAESYEKEHGVHCEKRIENNKRRALEKESENKAQYKEEQQKRAQLVHDLYMKSENGKAFQKAMKEQGFDLTTGKRRALSFVDETGKIHSLSRHINMVIDKEQNPKWRSDMKAHMAETILSNAALIAEQRKKEWIEQQHFDRDKYHAEWQNKVDQAGIEEDKHRKTSKLNEKKSNREDKDSEKTNSIIDHDLLIPQRFKDSYEFLEKLDRAKESRMKRDALKAFKDKKLKDQIDLNSSNDNASELEKKRKKIQERQQAKNKTKGNDRDMGL